MLTERAVINAGPLFALSLAGHLELLPALFAEFWIPEEVFHEVAIAGLGQPGAETLSDARWSAHIRSTPEPDPLLVADLDPGEAAVIALTRSLAPCMAIIDEKRGRRIAQSIYGLPVKGTAGLLVEAHRRGLLSHLRETLLALRAAGYFLSDAVIEAACAAIQNQDPTHGPANGSDHG
jgi:predicted nucleic acid-binding protein